MLLYLKLVLRRRLRKERIRKIDNKRFIDVLSKCGKDAILGIIPLFMPILVDDDHRIHQWIGVAYKTLHPEYYY